MVFVKRTLVLAHVRASHRLAGTITGVISARGALGQRRGARGWGCSGYCSVRPVKCLMGRGFSAEISVFEQKSLL